MTLVPPPKKPPPLLYTIHDADDARIGHAYDIVTGKRRLDRSATGQRLVRHPGRVLVAERTPISEAETALFVAAIHRRDGMRVRQEIAVQGDEP